MADNRPVPVIGFLTRNLEPNDTFLQKTWKFVYELSVRHRCHLLMVSGQVLAEPESEKQTQSAVFRLVTRRLLDGAILSQSVINRASESERALFDHDLADLPLASGSIALGKHPAVMIDNKAGMRQLIRHLVKDHGFRKIVHVRGPVNNREADDREDVWREELAAAGIAIRPEWLVRGDFDYGPMATIGRDILDSSGRDIDAVVACNDMAAIRILEDFEALGISVPGDIAVCGFDDIDSAQLVMPALSTVQQPIEAQMALVWGQLEARLRGESPENQTLGTSAVVRASCGCAADHWSVEAFPLLDRHETTRRAVSFYEGLAGSFRWKSYHLNDFFQALNRISSFDQIRTVLETWLPRLGYHHFALFRVCSSEGGFLVWDSRVPPGSVLPLPPPAFRVIAAFPENGLSEGRVLASAEFSLSGWEVLNVPLATGLFPLSVESSWHGLLALHLTAEAGLHERNIQDQLSSLLDRLERERNQRETEARMRARVAGQQEATKALERLVAEVAHEINTPLAAILSSGALLESRFPDNAPLLAEFGLRLAAPDVSTPRQQRLQMTRLLRAHGIENAEERSDALTSVGIVASGEGLLKGSELGGRLDEIIEAREISMAARIVTLGSEKIRDFVERLRKTTVQKTEAAPALEALDTTIETALILLGTGNGRAAIERRYSAVPRVLCRPNELQQVWINLIRNAQQSCGNTGTITVSTTLEGKFVRVDVGDDGPGIPKDIQDRIFEPFFTTRPKGGGLGLGLDIARRLVEEVGGRISFQSEPGKTTFSVWLATSSGFFA